MSENKSRKMYNPDNQVSGNKAVDNRMSNVSNANYNYENDETVMISNGGNINTGNSPV
jgi:hypothetical protein